LLLIPGNANLEIGDSRDAMQENGGAREPANSLPAEKGLDKRSPIL
jgi:hypothetical protein